jgi:hypothetical protein
MSKQNTLELLEFDFNESVNTEPYLVYIQDVLDVLRKEGVDNTVILAVKELTI